MNQPNMQPLLITRDTVRHLLGGISKSTFWRRCKQWEAKGTPFPQPAPGTTPIYGGTLYRYKEVMEFFKRIGIIEQY